MCAGMLAMGREVGRGWLPILPSSSPAEGAAASRGVSHTALHPQHPGPAWQAAALALPPASCLQSRPARACLRTAGRGHVKQAAPHSRLCHAPPLVPESAFFPPAVFWGRFFAVTSSPGRLVSLQQRVHGATCLGSACGRAPAREGEGWRHRRPHAGCQYQVSTPVHLTVIYNTMHLPSRALCS